MKFMTSIWLNVKNKLANVVLSKISDSDNPDIKDVISTLNYILQTKNFSNVSTGWNSPNPKIKTKFNNVQEEIIELGKLSKFLKNKVDRRLVTGYINNSLTEIDIHDYFRDKNKNKIQVSDSIKSITGFVEELLRSYENFEEDKGSYEYSMLTLVFKELENTLNSLSVLE